MEIPYLKKFSNFHDHPAHPQYKIFYFVRKDMADEFEMLLTRDDIPFERDDNDEYGRYMALFAIKNSYFKQALKLNFLSYGKYRQPLIKDKFLKYFLLLGVLSIIVLAFIGYIKSR